MWYLFRLTNLFWLLAATYIWITSTINQGPILAIVNFIMAFCVSMMPIKIKFDALLGRVIVAILLIGLWFLWIDGPIMGVTTILMYMPVMWLLMVAFKYMVAFM